MKRTKKPLQKIQKNKKRLLFRRLRVLSISVTDAKLIFQLLHVYAIHKYLNICKRVYTLKVMAERAAEKGRIRGARPILLIESRCDRLYERIIHY